MGCVAWARQMVADAASDRPKYPTFPALTKSSIAPTVSSIRTVGSTRCRYYKTMRSTFDRRSEAPASRTYSGVPLIRMKRPSEDL